MDFGINNFFDKKHKDSKIGHFQDLEHINGVSISMVIFGALSLGVIIGYIIAVFSVLSSKAQNRKLQNKIKGLSDELNNLRNVAVNETVYEDDGLN